MIFLVCSFISINKTLSVHYLILVTGDTYIMKLLICSGPRHCICILDKNPITRSVQPNPLVNWVHCLPFTQTMIFALLKSQVPNPDIFITLFTAWVTILSKVLSMSIHQFPFHHWLSDTYTYFLTQDLNIGVLMPWLSLIGCQAASGKIQLF